MAHFQRQPITLIVMGHVRSSGEARFRFKMADLTSKDKPTTKRKNILDYFGQRNEHSQDVESEKTAAVTESNDESSSVSKKVKYDHTFQQEWLEDWPWLRHDTKGMSCYLCIKHKKRNTMTTGHCNNYRTSTIDRHVESTDHITAKRAEALSRDFEQVSRFRLVKT